VILTEKGAQPQVTPVSVPKLEGGEVLVKILAMAVNP
jgi:NADPH:quinone reductase-like Zn-dependent oxidoreductase